MLHQKKIIKADVKCPSDTQKIIKTDIKMSE